MFGSFAPSMNRRSKNSSFGMQQASPGMNQSQQSFSPGQSYKPNFGQSFGQPQQSQNPTFTPPANTGIPQPQMQQPNPAAMQMRAMMPNMNSIWNPQAMGQSPMLRNTETGQNIDLAQNKNPYGDFMSQFRDRVRF